MIDGNIPRNDYVGTGAVATYAYTFKIWSAADLAVYVQDTGGNITLKTLNVDYSVSGVLAPNGGTITLLAGNLATGYKLNIRMQLALNQQTDLRNQSAYHPDTLEDQLDKMTRMIQQIQDAANRSLRLPRTDTTVSDLADSVARANKMLGFDANGLPTVLVPASGSAASVLADLANTSNVILGDALIGVKVSATGAAARTLHARMNGWTILSDFDDGVRTYTQMWQQAVASGSLALYVDVGGTLTAQIDIPNNMVVYANLGAGAAIGKGFNGDLFTLGSYCRLINLWINGNGGTFTGRGILINTGTSDQKILGCQIQDCASACIEFTAINAGSRFYMIGWGVACTNPATPAIKLPAGEALTDGTRYFSHIATGGCVLMDPNGGNMTFIDMCNCTGMTLTSSTKQFHIANSRIAGVLTLDGSTPQVINCSIGNNIVINGTCAGAIVDANNIAGSIVLNSGASGCYVGPTNIIQGTGLIDNSGNPNTLYGAQDFTPTWKGDTADPALGNGTLTGRMIRRGREITIRIVLVAGSTTTFGTGAWYFLLPSPWNTLAAKFQAIGAGLASDSSATARYNLITFLAAATFKLYMSSGAGATSYVSATVPFTAAQSDSFILEASFEQNGL